MKQQRDKTQFTNQLLAWYKDQARILPWRQDCTSYRVWVSEIMLQQTRVEAVKPYFERFIASIPDYQTLANSEEETLLKLWEGLGYYNRVRNMKKCAQQCMKDFNGELPKTVKELVTLPGIGEYTAGAIASIAYNECVPAVDGNVLRVFSRVLKKEEDISKESTKKSITQELLSYLPKEECSAFNQALMELGALICVPNSAPRCNICPVSSQCIAYQTGMAHRLPNKAKKKKRKKEQHTICILVCGSRIHLNQRPAKGLLAGLYEFDNLVGDYRKKVIMERYQELNILEIKSLPKTKHLFSHIEWHMKGYFIRVAKTNDEHWYNLDEINQEVALPSAFHKYKELLIERMKEEKSHEL